MTYTLVGAPALGFDLARLRGGARVAAVLRVAAVADSGTLSRLAARHPGPMRDVWEVACEQATGNDGRVAPQRGRAPARLSDVLPSVGRTLGGGLGEVAAAHALLRRLETGLVGDVTALRRLVSHELLDHTWVHAGPVHTQDPEAARAADVLADAAVAAYAGEFVPSRVRRAMALPYVGSRVPVRDETVPTGFPELDERLEAVANADEAVRGAWRDVVERHRPTTAAWAPAMHQATWALQLTDRLRLAFDAQMAAVGVFTRAGFTRSDAAYGVWNALSGVVQATVVADLLPDRDADVLLRPWREVHGS